mmetsp:Transcript_25773/g.70995  ORF Transcript_25773/g.70995 Transcript_25773/m.70995 type:complete len:358 (+) Transcript_25773:39-1112(+)
MDDKEKANSNNDMIGEDAFRGNPLSSREETRRVMDRLLTNDTTTNDSVFGQGPFVLSDIPVDTLRSNQGDNGVILGIDEAGRGSVLGSMIYGCAYWKRPNGEDDQGNAMFADSKQLTEERRSFLWKNHIMADPTIGFAVRVLTASEISRYMNQKTPYNLNQMSHDAAIQMIQRLLDKGVNIEHCYIDTVGNPVYYQQRLEQLFGRHSISFTVEPKADDKYPVCSAASVVAKVTRDTTVQHLSSISEKSLGSGYPSDPTCQSWIQHELQHRGCPVFGFSADSTPLVRFSWNPIKLAFEKETGGTRSVVFEAQMDDDEIEEQQMQKRQRQSMQAFLGKSNKKRRFPYMEQKGIRTVSGF